MGKVIRVLIGFWLLSSGWVLAQTVMMDLDKGIAFLSYGRMVYSVGLEVRDGPIISEGTYRVSKSYIPPRLNLSLIFEPPWIIELDHGITVSNNSSLAHIILPIAHHEYSWIDSVKEITFFPFPWYVEEEELCIQSAEFLEFLPAYLQFLGLHDVFDRLYPIVRESAIPNRYFFGDPHYSLFMEPILVVQGLPLLVRYRSSRSLSSLEWRVNEESFHTSVQYIVPTETFSLRVTLDTEDRFGNRSSEERAFTPMKFELPVHRTIHFERIRLNQSILFPGNHSGIWHVMGQRFPQQNLRWNFDVPGEYSVYQISPGHILYFRVMVQP